MTIKRIFCFLLLAAMLICCFASCKDQSDSTDTGTDVGTDAIESLDFSGVTVCTAPSTIKVLQVENFSSGTTTLTFQAFRNEYESAQLIMSAERNVLSYNVTLEDLTCGDQVLSKDHFSVYNEKYIQIAEVFDPLSGSKVGMYPDALLPMETAIEYQENQIRAGMNQGIWFTVKIPKDQAAGVYSGHFTLTIDGVSKDFPVEVTVWNYAISDETHQKSSYAVYTDALGMGELSNTNEMEELYTEALLEYRLNPQSLPIGLGHTFDPSQNDLRNWVESTVKYTQDERCSWINIPYKRISGTLPSGKNSTSMIDIDLYKSTLKMVLERSLKEEINLMSKLGMWVTCLDEADYRNKPEDTEVVTAALHQAQIELYNEYKKQVDETGTLWMGFVHKCDAEFILEVLENMRTIQHFITTIYADDSRFNFENPFTRCVQLLSLRISKRILPTGPSIP